MIKVLQIIDGYNYNGIAKLMVDTSKYLSKDIKFDYLTSINICDNFYNLNVNRKSIFGRIVYNHRLYKFLKKNKYDIVHINSGAFFFTFFCVIICRICRVKRVIVHSHNKPRINIFKKVLIKILNPLYRRMIDVKLSCSKEAINSLFTNNKAIIINNGINVDEFKYNEKIRNKYRKELGIEDKIVYGHVGNFNKQKNHDFLIDLFNEIQKNSNSVLLLIGSGSLEETIKLKVKKLNLESKVLFLGYREDVGNLLNCMDVFLFPSLYEGFGISLIEAQTTGLSVVVSKGVTEEVKISNNFYRVNNFCLDDWINIINSIKTKNRKTIINNNYDIKKTAKDLEKIYKDLVL